MKKSLHSESAKRIATLLVAMVVGWFVSQSNAFAQSPRQRPKTTEYDYKSLALVSIRESVQDARRLTNINHKIRFLIEVSSILSDSSKKEAIDVLDLALAELREWESNGDPPE